MDQPSQPFRVQRAVRVLPGALLILAILVLSLFPAIVFCTYGESFFSLTRRVPAEVLVVEGWIDSGGVRAATAEFVRGGYKYIVTTGGQSDDGQFPTNYAETAGQELIRFGIPKDEVIVAPAGKIEHERTFRSALAAWRALQKKDIHPKDINVFTLGPHARRSRLVYAKVFAPATDVGVVAWAPVNYETEPWWQSRGRTKCLFKEVVGYPFEVLLNSGRTSNSAD